MPIYHAVSGSAAEDLFIELFSDAFGAEKTGYLYSQYHFYDIYQNSCYADFVLENGAHRIDIEIDGETSHSKSQVASNKFYDDLLKQNSMVYWGWDVYRWAVRQIQVQPEAVKDELRVFLGSHPQFREIEECHRALIDRLDKPERKLVLQIIDAKDRIAEDTAIDSFFSGFELAWKLSAELNHYENEHSVSRRMASGPSARFIYKREEEK